MINIYKINILMFIKMRTGRLTRVTKPIEDDNNPIPKDIWEKLITHRITPEKIKGKLPRTQESWKL